jgi:hypothetical protein
MKKKIQGLRLIKFAILAGCMVLEAVAFGQNAKSQNVFLSSPALPENVRRVLVLPLTCESSRTELLDGCEMLDPILETELVKAKKFEVVPAGSAVLDSLTGQSAWTGGEILPSHFFDSLQRFYGCDAVLFCQLTTFCAYSPLSVGWRLKLVDVHTQKIIWAVDEAFDAGDPAVAKDAEQFQKQQQNVHGKTGSLLHSLVKYADRQPPVALDDQWSILNSPRYFGRYSAFKLLQTLPKR